MHCLLILLAGPAFSQQYDNTWMFGYSDALPFRTTSMNFSGGAPDTSTHQETLSMFVTNASISDSAGNLLFYTNGKRIYKKNYSSVPGSNGFNPGFTTDDYPSGLPHPQGVLILPVPGHHNLYGVFHESADTFRRSGFLDENPEWLGYTEISTNQSGNATVVSGTMNTHVLDDTLALGRITACRHANGRDWWIIVHKYWSNCWYKLLFTPAGGSLVDSQCLGRISQYNDAGGEAVFSPDGSKYAMVGSDNVVEIMDFDRCSGNLSNYHQDSISMNTGGGFLRGCSISPNSRFLYVNEAHHIYQYDLNAANILGSRLIVSTWDSTNTFQDWFFLNQLGPDGKIYIASWGGSWILHRINFPDSLGLSCYVQQEVIHLDTTGVNNVSVPNFPNYRLGPLIGSACDTLGLSIPKFTVNYDFRIFPNPASEYADVIYQLPENTDAVLEIRTTTGILISSEILPKWSTTHFIDVSQLAQGIYLVELKTQKGRDVRKLLKF